MQKVLFYDGKEFSSQAIDSVASLRWGCWAKDGERALLVGNRGSVFQLADGEVERIPIPSSENLRCAEFSPDGDSAVVVGNRGTVIKLDDGAEVIDTSGKHNLRRVAWRPDGGYAMIVGNDGAAYRFSRTLNKVEGAENNLRSVSWQPDGKYAIITGNCLRPSMSGLVPTSNLYKFQDGSASLEPLQPLSDSRADLISSVWKPDGSLFYAVGFDSVWQTPAMYTYDGQTILQQPLAKSAVYPTCFAWHPSGEYALMGTGRLSAEDRVDGRIYKFKDRKLKLILKLDRFWLSCIAWNRNGRALIVGSRNIRAFSV